MAGDGSTARIFPLTGKRRRRFAIVDAEDFEALRAMGRWIATPGSDGKRIYARLSAERGYRPFLHQAVMRIHGAQPAAIDHINGCGLDNRKKNLRECSSQQNQRNSKARSRNRVGAIPGSRFKGVSRSIQNKRNRWQAHIKIDNRTRALGYFSTEVDAAAAYNRAALLHFGEFAKLNDLQAAPLYDSPILATAAGLELALAEIA